MTFLAVYFLLVPAACAFVLYKFARLLLWSSPILATLAGAVMAAVYLGGLPNPADDRWLTYLLLLMPIQQLIAIPPSDHIAAGIERLLALVFQASLAIFIYLAIQHKELKHLFPIAIVLHIIGYLPANLTNVGILNNTMISLCLTGTVVVFTAAYAYRMYHQLEKS